jgi:hypothetical protein
MTTITLCPACLAELPDDYPYDHVVIDRVLTTQPELLSGMTRRERREVVVTGLTRGMSISALSVRLNRAVKYLRELLPADHPESAISNRNRRAAERAHLDVTVRDLWDKGLPDTDIALRTGTSVYVVGDTRRRLGLATHTARYSLFAGGPR